MTNVQKYFEKFHVAIRTDYDMSEMLRTKRDIILGRIRRYLENNRLPGFVELLQGSYKMKTGVVPTPGLEYDIDVGLRFNFSENDYSAETVRGWVFAAVDGHTEDVKAKGPCIRVTYSDGYHVDLVIYSRWTGAWGTEQYRLAHKTDGWRPAEPIKLLDHVKTVRQPFAGTEDDATKTDQFRRVVRCLRRWNDVCIPSITEAKPTGLAFVLLAAKYLSPGWSWSGPDDRAALETLATTAGDMVGRIIAHKPTPEYEDMFGRLSDDEMDALKTRFRTLAKALRDAGSEPDPVEACKILMKVFGDDFPVPDPPETAKQTCGPAIVTSSSSA